MNLAQDLDATGGLQRVLPPSKWKLNRSSPADETVQRDGMRLSIRIDFAP